MPIPILQFDCAHCFKRFDNIDKCIAHEKNTHVVKMFDQCCEVNLLIEDVMHDEVLHQNHMNELLDEVERPKSGPRKVVIGENIFSSSPTHEAKSKHDDETVDHWEKPTFGVRSAQPAHTVSNKRGRKRKSQTQENADEPSNSSTIPFGGDAADDGSTLSSSYAARIHYCDICQANFKTYSGVHHHKKAVHEKLQWYCPYCSYFTPYRSTLFRHIRKQHADKPQELTHLESGVIPAPHDADGQPPPLEYDDGINVDDRLQAILKRDPEHHGADISDE